MSPISEEQSLGPKKFVLWRPAPGQAIEVGAEQTALVLPALPLPLLADSLNATEVSAAAIGQGVYDYLREFPDCPHNVAYAELLRDAFPHFLADLGSQILMLDHKEVDSFYVRRKITYMKILALLDGGNPGLLQQLGIGYYHLSQMFTEFNETRQHLLKAMACFHRLLKVQPDNLAALNYLAQIDFLFGDYPAALDRWQQVVAVLEDGPARQALLDKITELSSAGVPDYPLIDDYEQIGVAMACYGRGETAEAATMLDMVEERGRFLEVTASPEFYYLLAVCRSGSSNAGGAFEALEKALELDPQYPLAQEALDRLQETGRI